MHPVHPVCVIKPLCTRLNLFFSWGRGAAVGPELERSANGRTQGCISAPTGTWEGRGTGDDELAPVTGRTQTVWCNTPVLYSVHAEKSAEIVASWNMEHACIRHGGVRRQGSWPVTVGGGPSSNFYFSIVGFLFLPKRKEALNVRSAVSGLSHASRTNPNPEPTMMMMWLNR